MPTSEQHNKQAQHNLTFLQSFYSNHSYNDWTITVSFYIAVHIVESAIFSTEKLKYGSHDIKLLHSDDLPEALKKIASSTTVPKLLSPHQCRKLIVQFNFQDINDAYNDLYRTSRTARYKNYNFANYQVDLSVKGHLVQLIAWGNTRFGMGLVFTP